MRISHFFIDRPIFAAVLSIVFVILGGGRLQPPADRAISGDRAADHQHHRAISRRQRRDRGRTVVAPIEQQVNGVEGMLYISSNSSADGRFSIAVTFDLGVNLDIAQVQVQNRVATATPRLPLAVQQIGVTVAKSSPDILMVVNLYSPDQSRDAIFLTNYANLQIKDVLTRLDGVGSITVFGARDFAMQVWLDPNRLQSLGLTAADVTLALQGQNIQVASGVLNQPPVPNQLAFQVAVRTLGRLTDPVEFANIVDQADPECGGAHQGCRARRTDRAGLFLVLVSWPKSLRRARRVPAAGLQRAHDRRSIRTTTAELAKNFPEGMSYTIIYDPTQFIRQSVDAVIETIFEAVILVVLVIVLFLQTWRAAVIPIVAIPISLVGTFFMMSLFGFTINNLSLFGLVLAIGIVVDDAIVVVENVERNIERGFSRATPRSSRWTRSAARWSRSRLCCARCSFRPPSSPAFPASSTGNSRSPSRARP